MRIGIGYDIHRIAEDRDLVIGGVKIPYIKGLLGHSDADVLLHAVSDAILGAIGETDIGEHFPDTDPAYKGASSVILLKKVVEIAAEKGYKVLNIDTVLIAEEPKIKPFKDDMKENISRVLKIPKDSVNIKATTNEGVGPIGRGEAMAAHAAVLMEEA